MEANKQVTLDSPALAFQNPLSAVPVQEKSEFVSVKEGGEFSADFLVSVIALGVAVVALWTSIREGRSGRKHAKLSVTPHISVLKNVQHQGPVGFTLKNNGIGPARVLSIRALIGGNWSGAMSESELRDLIKVLGVPLRCNWQSMKVGDIIAVGEERNVFHFPTKGAGTFHQDQCVQAINSACLEVEYESLYGERQKSSE